MNHLRYSKFILISVSLLALCASCNRSPFQSKQASPPVPAASQLAQAPATPKPCALQFNGAYVSDFAEVVKPDSKNALELKLTRLKELASIDFLVVTTKTIGDEPIADYSLALARCWEVGERNPDKSGLLLLLAVSDRRWHMQVSRSIEKVLSNEEIQEAGRSMTPHLRQSNYDEGLNAFVDATIATLAPRRGFPANLNQ